MYLLKRLIISRPKMECGTTRTSNNQPANNSSINNLPQKTAPDMSADSHFCNIHTTPNNRFKTMVTQ